MPSPPEPVRRRVYLDYNASAPLRPEAQKAWASMPSHALNPSSVHFEGREAKKHLEAARRKVADLLACAPSEVVFTSGGSESDNLAIRGSMRPGGHLVLSAVEHPAVRETARAHALAGAHLSEIGVDERGLLDFGAYEAALERGADLISVMAVNNETGVIHDVAAIVDAASQRGIPVHVDAVQALGRIPLPSAAALVSLSGHKIGGPVGIGVLLVREGHALAPQICGGAQERGRRAGTESVHGAAAFAAALEVALVSGASEQGRLKALGLRLESVLRAHPGVRILGAEGPRVAGVSCALFDGTEAESLLLNLDLDGISASSGSACASGSLEPSHVLRAMGLTAEQSRQSVRFSMGWASDSSDIDALEAVLGRCLSRARAGALSDAAGSDA